MDADGNAIVTGDASTIKYSGADGEVLWEQMRGGGAMALDAGGNVVVAGSADYSIVKYSASDGTLLWERQHCSSNAVPEFTPAGANSDSPVSAAVDANGNVVVTGVDPASGVEYYTAKYAAADGAVLWETRHRGPGELLTDGPAAVTIDPNDNVIVTGYADYFVGLTDTFLWYVAKFAAADGALLWDHQSETQYGEPHHAGVTTDALGNVIMGGHQILRVCLGDIRQVCYHHNLYFIAKYAASDGAPRWERQNEHDGGSSVAVDTGGNVVVAGNSQTGQTRLARDVFPVNDYYTAKYAAQDGTLVWEKRYNHSTDGDDSATALALDTDGSVIVTGSSNGDLGTIKYVMTEVTYPTPIVLSVVVAPDGARLRFTGDAGRTYRLQRASNPSGPWTTLATLTAPPDGAVELLDSAPLASPAFYRVAAP